MGRREDLTADLIWLCSIDYAGTTWRYASEACIVTQADGTELAYGPGLTPLDDVTQALASVSSTPAARSQSVEIAWDETGTTALAELVEQGHDLAAARGEVALWPRGMLYEERIVVVSGLVREPEYGAEGEGVGLTIEDEPWDDRARLCEGVADVVTWPDVHPHSEGAVYPWVIGQPGYYLDSAGVATRSSGSPAVCVSQTTKSANTLLIAGHHVDTGQVYVVYDDESTGGRVIDGPHTVSNTYDANNRQIATIDVSTAGAALRSAGEWWISWSEGGALPSRYHAGGAVSTLGELLRTLADASTAATEGGAWATLEELLPWPVAGYVDDPATTPLGWLLDAVQPLAPIGICAGDHGGLVPVLWRYDARAEEAVDVLVAQPGVVRVGRVRYERAPRDVSQRITVRWAYRVERREWARETDLRPDRDEVGTDATTSAQAIAADLAYRRPGEPLRSSVVESALIWSDTTASRVAHWRLRRDGYAARIVQYDVGQDRAWYRVGDVLLLTDADIAIEEVVALLVERRLSDVGQIRLTLQILDGLYSDGTYAPAGRHDGPTWTYLGN